MLFLVGMEFKSTPHAFKSKVTHLLQSKPADHFVNIKLPVDIIIFSFLSFFVFLCLLVFLIHSFFLFFFFLIFPYLFLDVIFLSSLFPLLFYFSSSSISLSSFFSSCSFVLSFSSRSPPRRFFPPLHVSCYCKTLTFYERILNRLQILERERY